MLEIQGKYNHAKIFTDNVDDATIGQVIELCNQEFAKDSQIRIMPDCHYGAGCTIGTTMTIQDKIVPNLVGVDIGCVDKDTEFLSPTGWKKISEYNGEEIAVYDKTTNSTKFSKPLAFIKNKESEFYHLKTKYGINQMLSKEHTVLLEKGAQNRPKSRGQLYTMSAEQLYHKHNNLQLGIRDYFISEIPNLQIKTNIPLNDEQIRVQIMVMADAHLENKTSCHLSFKKERKINRAKQLLNAAHIEYTEKIYGDVTKIRFKPPVMEKRISYFYPASIKQLAVICDEIKFWDYAIDQNAYCSIHKDDVDFVQYAFATQGVRTSINHDNRERNASYRCLIAASKPRVQLAGTPKTDIKIVASVDGYKYCFTTDTGFWIMRRGGCIAITGNCGMHVSIIELGKDAISFDQVDAVIRAFIPSGQSVHAPNKRHAFSGRIPYSSIMAPFDVYRAQDAMGTLGGGNHFVEINEINDNTIALVIHSGSRSLGAQIAKYYQNVAYDALTDNRAERQRVIAQMKQEGREQHISHVLARMDIERPVINKELSYLTGAHFDAYMHDMRIAQQYAQLNRQAMADTITKRMGWVVKDTFDTIHNYIDFDTMIMRKGAISAQKDERVIIPINMRDGSIIAYGKGNPDWNYSGPHGAGRIFSRSQAKQNVSLDEFQHAMKDVWTTSVGESTLDESPMAYKSLHDILDNITESLDVVQVMKPLYNFKAN